MPSKTDTDSDQCRAGNVDDTVHVGFPRSVQHTWALTLRGLLLKALLHTLLASSKLYQYNLKDCTS